jgi:hypothetical protein
VQIGDGLKSIAKTALWHVGGPWTKGALIALDLWDWANDAWNNNRIGTPRIAKGTIFEPIIEFGKRLHNGPTRAGRDSTSSTLMSPTEEDAELKWRNYYRNYWRYQFKREAEGKPTYRPYRRRRRRY